MTYENLLKTISRFSIPLDEKRFGKVYQFMLSAHGNARRLSGDPFYTHPVEVAKTLASWKQSQVVLEAALLHDTVEDTSVTLEEIEKKFGSEVAFLVNGVTKVGEVKIKNKLFLSSVENLRKMFVAMAKDIRVILIKLADRHHNLKTLSFLSPAKRKQIALNTLEIYAPLAERLGMGKIKGELEDLAFSFADPKAHTWIKQIAEKHIKEAAEITESSIKYLKRIIANSGVSVKVHGRPKHAYSLYRKLMRPGIDKDFSKVYDLIALRIITKTKNDCYTALGLVHSHFKPVPHLGISDFIAQPKPNGYRSIHTKVFDRHGKIIEIQIRSQKMHLQAEYGAASHSFYSDLKYSGSSDQVLESGRTKTLVCKSDWIRELAKWQEQINNPNEFVSDLKLDALSGRIYVYTPLGDVIDLPQASTPVDFAFAIHGDLGFFIQGSKVNQKIVTLDYQLKNGDIVEIIKSKNHRKSSSEWLRFVKTAKARAEIKKDLNQQTQSARIQLQYK